MRRNPEPRIFLREFPMPWPASFWILQPKHLDFLRYGERNKPSHILGAFFANLQFLLRTVFLRRRVSNIYGSRQTYQLEEISCRKICNFSPSPQRIDFWCHSNDSSNSVRLAVSREGFFRKLRSYQSSEFGG
jgi:hypothetical protein